MVIRAKPARPMAGTHACQATAEPRARTVHGTSDQRPSGRGARTRRAPAGSTPPAAAQRQLLDAVLATAGAIVDAPDRDAVLEAACRALVDSGVVSAARIDGDDDGDGRPERLATAGDTTDAGASSVFPLACRTLPSAALAVQAAAGTLSDGDLATLARLAGLIGGAIDSLGNRLAAERLFRETADSLRAGVMRIDADGRFRYVNEAAASQLRRSRAEVIGQRVLDIGPDPMSRELVEQFRRAMEHGVAQHFEAAVGSGLDARWYDVDVQPTSAGVTVLSVDRTERRAALDQLRAGEDLRRRMLEGVDAIIAYQEAAPDVPTLSPQVKHILGYSCEEIAPHTAWRAAIHPDDLAACQAAWASSDGTWDLTYRMHRADGSWIWVHDRGVRIVHDDGRGPGMFSIVVDDTERQRSIDALRRSEERFAELFSGVDALLVYRCPDEGIALLSDVGERILGYPVARLADAAFWNSLVHPDDLSACQARWDQPGDGWSLEYRMRRADGAWIWVRDTVRRVVPSGAGPRMFGIVRDITESHRAADALRASEERYRLIVDGAADGILVSDVAGHYIEANPAICQMLGYTREELLARTVLSLRAADDLLPHEQMDQQISAAVPGSGLVVERRYRRKDGTVLIAEVNLIRLPDGGLLRTVRDIGPRLAGQAERERLASAVKQTAEAVVITDPHATITYVNPAFERVTGYAASEVVGRNPRLLKSGVHDHAFYREMWSTLKAGRTWAGELVNRRKDGTLFVEQVSISPIHAADGSLAAYVGVKRDITAEREREAAQSLEAGLRDRLARTIAVIPEGAAAADVAQALVDELASIPSIGFAAVFAFANGSEAQVVAHRAPDGFPLSPDQHTRLTRALRDTARLGSWAQAWQPAADDGVWGRALTDAGFQGIAFGPIVHGDHADGAVVMATTDPVLARTLIGHAGGHGDFSNTASALLAGRLHAERARLEDRLAMQQLIALRAFHPVFQPIVDLETRDTVGYEALTRFDGGYRPDEQFGSAWRLGLGRELELATLAAALEDARHLPAGRWLDINVSPGLLLGAGRQLVELLRSANRPLVLEVTEHERIEDYPAVRNAAYEVSTDIRLAVDDAGSGTANFGHIVDLGADFVKLDISLVRGIDASLGRQALVIGMCHFSRTTGCRLVAEGIETEGEAETLVQLGVEYGQGYLFGRPERATMWHQAHGRAERAPRREAAKVAGQGVPRHGDADRRVAGRRVAGATRDA